MYLVEVTYLKPVEEVNKVREEHLKFLEGFTDNKTLVVAGRKEDSSGGILIFADNKEEVERFMRDDPYFREGLTKYSCIRFIPSQYPKKMKAYFA